MLTNTKQLQEALDRATGGEERATIRSQYLLQGIARPKMFGESTARRIVGSSRGPKPSSWRMDLQESQDGEGPRSLRSGRFA